MARADLILDLLKYSYSGNNYQYKKVIEAMIADERRNKHTVLADRMQVELALLTERMTQNGSKGVQSMASSNVDVMNYIEKLEPSISFDQLILPKDIKAQTNELVEEHMRADVLRSYAIEPRNKIMLVGDPGTGKTSYAMALSERLMLPLYVVKYDALVGAYLGETANRLSKLMDFAKTNPCVLFFDEFDTIGKERGDLQDVGEIKRVVSSLLLQIDMLPSYSVAIGATNHPELLDRAVWRRFQLRIEFPKPTNECLRRWIRMFMAKYNMPEDVYKYEEQILKALSGHSYADAETWGLNLVRKYILSLPSPQLKELVSYTLKEMKK